MKKITSLVTSALLAISLTLSVSANTVFYKDFKTSQNLDELIPSPNAGTDYKEPEFTADGMRVAVSTNFHTYCLDYSKTGIDFSAGKYYLVSFEATVTEGLDKAMVIQLLDHAKGYWMTILDEIPINADGTVKASAVLDCGYWLDENYADGSTPNIDIIACWGMYNNNPSDYTLQSIKIEECDADGNVIAAETSTADTADTTGTGSTTVATADKASADTGIEGVAIIAAVAIVAAGGIVISRKKK